MNKKSTLEAFKREIVKGVSPDRFANKFLSKRLWQYKKIRLGRSDNRLMALADIYRNIELFLDEVCNTLDEIRGEIINEVEGRPTEVFFPDIKKKLVLEEFDNALEDNNLSSIDTMFIEIEDMKTNKDWINAFEQDKMLKREREKRKGS